MFPSVTGAGVAAVPTAGTTAGANLGAVPEPIIPPVGLSPVRIAAPSAIVGTVIAPSAIVGTVIAGGAPTAAVAPAGATAGATAGAPAPANPAPKAAPP